MTDLKITEFDPNGTLNGNEQGVFVQVGKNVRVTLTAIKNFILSSFNWIVLSPQTSPPTREEGLVFFDNTKKAVSSYNEVPDMTVNHGEEFISPIVINNTGSQIDNGDVVYFSGVNAGFYEIALANAEFKDRSRRVYVATHDIANGAMGRVTRLGEVEGLDLSLFSIGDVAYLSTTDGELTTTVPTDGGYAIMIGIVKSNSATEGILYVDPLVSNLTVEVTDTNGFPPDQRTATTLSFVDGTRTLTITPTGSDFHYYQLGLKYEKTTGESIIIADTTGSHIIYYDAETLSELVNPTSSQVIDVVLNKAFVSFIYWNATDGEGVIVQDERHGISMSPETHVYLHQRFGSFYVSGLAIENIVIGNGSSNTHAQYGTATGIVKDEDIAHNISTVTSTTGMTYLYRTGASGIFSKGTNAGYSFPVGSTPLPQYNEWTGATWQLTELTSGNYMNLHIFANGDINGEPFTLLGTEEYGTVSSATNGQANELSSILGTLPLPEFVLLATVIIEGKTSFTNTPNARVVQNSDGSDYTNWTKTELSAGAPPSSHALLSNLEIAATDEALGHIDNSAPLQLPELTTTERDAIASPNAGMKIYNTTDSTEQIYSGGAWMTIGNGGFLNQPDVDTTGLADSDLFQYEATSGNMIPIGKAPPDNIEEPVATVNITSNQSIGTVTASYSILDRSIIIKNTTAGTCTINIGTAAGTSDVLSSYSVTANQDLPVDILLHYFDSDDDQELFISSANFGTAQLETYFTSVKRQ